MILGLVGCGHIGGSLARALRDAGAVSRVIGQDRAPAAAERALALGIVDELGDAAAADVVVLAAPVLSIPDSARSLRLPDDTIVTDVGSTKASVVRACEPLFRRFVGGHPMAGSERAGPDAADGRLFKGKKAILTPTARTDRAALETVAGLWRAAGANVIEMDAERHDRVIAAVSHLPHAVAYALCAALAGDAEELRGLSGGGFVDTTRIASTPPGMWVDVFIDNAPRLLELLDRYRDELAILRAAIAAHDGAEIARLIGDAREARTRILG